MKEEEMTTSSRFINATKIKELVNKYRSWYWIKKNQHEVNPKQRFEFTLMSYNVLAQELLEAHEYLYLHCTDKAKLWSERWQRLQMEFYENPADIMCLQEVNSLHFENAFRPFLAKLGYAGIYKKRNGIKQDGCAIFYKQDKFILNEIVRVDFDQRTMSHLLDRDNVALIGVFKPRHEFVDPSTADNQIIIATTHLLFNPRRGDIKLAQLRLLFAEINKISTNSDITHPIILCGDMNTQPNSPIHRFLRTGKINPCGFRAGDLSGQHEGYGRGYPFSPDDFNMIGVDMTCCYEKRNESSGHTSPTECFKRDEKFMTLSHSLNLSSVYPMTDNRTNEAFVTTDHQQGSSMVDYIFYTRTNELRLKGFRHLLTSSQLQEIGSLPNEHLGSDHLSLQARFSLQIDPVITSPL